MTDNKEKPRFAQPPDSQINVLYCVKDADGVIVKQGQCSRDVYDLQADEPGHTVAIVPAFEDEELPPLRWDQRRKAEMPRVSDQLAAIWQGGTAMEEMRELIRAVNEKHPKPN